MKKTKKALASLAIAGMVLSLVPFNAFAAGTVPTRLAGVTAEQTAVKIADQTGWTGTAILASSASYGMVDALTSGPLAKFLKAPILLQGAGAALNADTKQELIKLAVKKVYVTSGTAVISAGVIAELKGMGIAVVSLGGNDRFDTSVNIAKEMVKLGAPVNKVAVAYGWLNQDALSVASIASSAGQPILLTEKDSVPASVKAFVAANITSSDVIGGTGVISETVKAQFPGATRHYGMTAYDTNNQVIQDFAATLNFDNVYVANAVTAIDALAGAPLAGETKSPIVLTDGKTVPAVAAFTFSKSSASTVVTALGGEAVVPESVRVGISKGEVTPDSNVLKIVSVSALNDANSVLEISFSKAIKKLETSDVAVQNANTMARYGVKTAILSANGMTATVELYSHDDANQANPVLAYVTNYTITVNADGTSLKTTFNRPAYVKERITDVDPADAKIKIGAVTVNIPSTVKFDYGDALGRKARVWYNADRDLVNIAYETEEVVAGGLEVTDTRSGSDVGEIEIGGEAYDLAEGSAFKFYLNDTSATLGNDGVEYDYARVFFDKSGDVELVVAYNWDEFLVVEKTDGDVAVSFDDSEVDLEDYLLVKDGKTIATSDLKKGDMIYFTADSNEEDGFAVVYNNSVTGEIEDVFSNEIRMDGKTYTYNAARYTNSAVQYLDGDEFKNLDSDAAEEFQAGGDVTLFLDHKGDAVFITGAQEIVPSNDLGLHLTEDVVYYNASGAAGRGTLELEGVNGDGDEKLYTFRVDTLETITNAAGLEYEVDEVFPGGTVDIDKFALSSLTNANIVALDEAGNVLGTVITGLDSLTQDNDFIEVQTDDAGVIIGLSFMTEKTFSETTNALELDDKFIDGYKLMSNTVVFDGSAGWTTSYKPDADDIDVTTWGALADEGFKVFEASYYVNDDNEVEYLVIKNSDAEDTTDYNAVVTKVLRNTDNEIIEMNVLLDGVKKTYSVDEVKLSTVVKESVVTLAVNDGDTTMVEDIDVVSKQGVVTAVNVSDRTVTISGVNAGTYTLVSDGSVINSKDTGDILVKALRDIKTGDTVNLSLDEEVPATSEFIDVVNIVSSGTVVTPVVTTGVVTYIDATNNAVYVDNVPYVYGTATILKTAQGSIIAVGDTAIDTALIATDEVANIVVVNGVVTTMVGTKVASVQTVAVTNVDTAIEALPTVTAAVLTDKAAVDAAKLLYDALTPARKDFVKSANVTKLSGLVAKMASLQATANAATDQLAADGVDTAIEALPTVAAAVIGNKAAIDAAKVSFDALTNAQEALVKPANATKLVDLLAKMVALQDVLDVATAKAALAIAGDLNNVNANLVLVAIQAPGTTVTWVSSNTAIVANNGSVTQPNGADVQVTLTATITKGAATTTKTFVVTVLGL